MPCDDDRTLWQLRTIADQLERMGPRTFTFQPYTGTALGSFLVRGGPLTREQPMGWHITDDKGFTVGVSCDEDFLRRVAELFRIARCLADMPDRDFDTADGRCRFCGGVQLHAPDCALRMARTLVKGDAHHDSLSSTG